MAKFVLVPGAWLGSWAWKKLVPLMIKEGHEAFPVTLTGMGERVHLARKEFGMEIAIQDVINIMKYEDLEEVVLVGHSFAGKVISAVYDRIPERIRMLIYLDAIVPMKIREPQGGRESMHAEELNQMTSLANERGEGWKIPLDEEGYRTFCFDIKGPDREWFDSKITPWPANLAFEPITLSKSYDSAKKAYIFCIRQGEKFNEEDLKYIHSLDGQHRIIETDHYPMINKPDQLMAALNELIL
jgi:pimeloyl-ACP methyl ester carboxylesterase